MGILHSDSFIVDNKGNLPEDWVLHEAKGGMMVPSSLEGSQT